MPARLCLPRLERHLQRSVLRLCLTPARLRRALLLGEPPSDAQVLHIAHDAAQRDAARAQALQAALDQEHAAALALWAEAAGEQALHARWRQSVLADGDCHARLAGAYWSLLSHPCASRALRHLAFGDVETRFPDLQHAPPLQWLIERRSVSPRALCAPGPDAQALEQMIDAALAAPDHGRLHPWRVIEFRAAQRQALADLFEQEKLRRDPLATPTDLRRARQHATQPPGLLGFVVCIRARSRVPAQEQWLAAGAALGNLLNAAHARGYGAIVLSGERCFDRPLCAALGLGRDEALAGFVSIGTVLQPPASPARALPQQVWQCWSPPPLAPVISMRAAAAQKHSV